MASGPEAGASAGHALPTVHVDVVSDTVCPWCFVGKRNLEAAIAERKDRYNVEVRWRPFLLNPNAPREGVDKRDYYVSKFGADRSAQMEERMKQLFAERGVSYKLLGKTGATLDSHRLLELAAQQGPEKQNALVEELFVNYFSEGKYIGDKEVLLDAARKVGVEGAEKWLDNPENGLQEVQEALWKYARNVNGVPHFKIGNRSLSGAQPPEALGDLLDEAVQAKLATNA